MQHCRNGVRTLFPVRRDRVKVFTAGFFGQLALCGNVRDENDIRAFLENAAATCGRYVSEREISDAIRHSRSSAFQRNRAQHHAWPAANHEQREAVVATGFALVDLWEISPVRFEDNEAHTEELIDLLFPGNPLLCCGRSKSDFATRSREDWRGKLSAMQLIVTSPMTARMGHTQDGKESEHTLENTGARRLLVIEQDSGTIEEQAAVLLHLAQRAPLVLAVHSGGKSIHGWFVAVGQSEDMLRRFMRYAVSLGADRATWTRSQFVRMPDGTRDNGKRQTVYFFNPEVLK
jgi:hypothetical protein